MKVLSTLGRCMRVAVTAFAAGALCLSASAQPARLPPEGFADLAERLTPAVVNIATRQNVEGVDELPRFPPGSPLERFNDGLEQGAAQITSLGSGFIISADGLVITNNHVIDAADAIEIIMQDGVRHEALVVGRDPATDIALLRMQSGTPAPFVVMGDSDTARVGDLVLAIGNPFGLGGSVSVGIVSARNRNIDAGRYDDFIQTDAAINRGNSGGPLFNLRGEVIGVNTAIVSPTGGSVGVGFATPTSIVQPVVSQLLQYGVTRRGWLGVRLANLTPDDARDAGLTSLRGAAITRISPQGPASRAGLRQGDIVLTFDGKEARDSRALTRMVGDAEVGKRVVMEIVRGDRRMTIEVDIALLEETTTAGNGARGGAASPPMERRSGGARGGQVMGLSLSELDPSLRAEFQIEPDVQGLVVLSIDPSSSAAGHFRVGDVIVRMGPALVDSIDAARAFAGDAEVERRSIVVEIQRDGARSYRRLAGRL